jgi:hypothetical protein
MTSARAFRIAGSFVEFVVESVELNGLKADLEGAVEVRARPHPLTGIPGLHHKLQASGWTVPACERTMQGNRAAVAWKQNVHDCIARSITHVSEPPSDLRFGIPCEPTEVAQVDDKLTSHTGSVVPIRDTHN